MYAPRNTGRGGGGESSDLRVGDPRRGKKKDENQNSTDIVT